MHEQTLRDVAVSMRDGTRLLADVLLPATAMSEPVPAILFRTPYDKTGVAESSTHFAEAGYAVVVQDKRGLHASDGEYRMLGHDRSDGYDTVEWVAAQPWCNGDVHAMGTSYLGHTSISNAVADPPHLRSALVDVAANDQFTSQAFLGGALILLHAQWVTSMSQNFIGHLPEEERASALAERIDAIDEGVDLFKRVPLTTIPLLRSLPRQWADILGNRENPEFFADSRFAIDEAGRVRVPVLHIGGFFDPFAANTTRQFRLASQHAANPDARQGQRLIMGPWPHDTTTDGTAGVSFPDARMDRAALSLAWVDGRRGDPDDPFRERVLCYVLGADRWRTASAWPPDEARLRPLYFAADRGLAWGAPSDEGADASDTFRYDPAHPYTAELAFAASSFDQSEHASGDHVLVYETAPVESELLIIGEPEAVLHASSSATDADWLVEIHVVDPGGAARLLTEGILRARYRASRTDPRPLVPGEVESYRIPLFPISVAVPSGGRIRVVVTGGKVPGSGFSAGYERNPNAFIPVESASEDDFVVAENTVMRSAAHPSHLLLPVVAEDAPERWVANPWPAAGPVS
jgi:putative CocE/NonD family hydrolase